MVAFVRVENLKKSFNGFQAVDDVSFSIPEKGILGLLGPNGAGKTTTISMLSGLLKPDRGEIFIGDYSMLREPLKAKALMGVVPQEIALYPALSARENLLFWGGLYKLKGKALKSRVDEVLELVGLSDRAKDPVEQYSGGMKRRVNIAAGLLHKPKLLMLDEPTVGVDPQSRRNILDIILQLKDEGMTVIYSSHYMEEVEELCRFITIMDHGKIIASGERPELMAMVEDRDLIRLETENEVERYESIANVPGVLGIAAADNTINITVANSRESLAPVIDAAGKDGLAVSSVSVEQPNLETVFLHLTGRGLRN